MMLGSPEGSIDTCQEGITQGKVLEQSLHESMASAMVSGIADARIIGFKQIAYELLWCERESFLAMHLDGGRWKQYIVEKIFQLDFLYQCFVEVGHNKHEESLAGSKEMRQFVLDMVMDSVIREVQISNFVEKICGKAIEWKEGEHPQTGAPGSAEEASRDTGFVDAGAVQQDEQKGVASLADRLRDSCTTKGEGQRALNQLFRGGMANRFEPLAGTDDEREQEELEDDDSKSIDYFSEPSSPEKGNEESSTEGSQGGDLDTSMVTVSSGRSYYAEFFQRKAGIQGGAGGSNTTQNARLTKAVEALGEVMKSFETPPSQTEAATQEAVINKIAKLVEQWKEKTPTREQMREQLRKMYGLLEKDLHKRVDPKESRENKGAEIQQSFYGDFVKKLREETDEGFVQKGSKKGKGKGKSKAKGKNEKADTLPKFDMQKICPTKALTTWQLLSRNLEAGKDKGSWDQDINYHDCQSSRDHT